MKKELNRSYKNKNCHSLRSFGRADSARPFIWRYKYMKYIVAISLMIFSVSSFAGKYMITKVQVLDSEFSVLQLISDQHDLELVEQEWSKLEKIDSLRNHDWTHTIDITSETIGGRWSYNSSGYLAKLNKTLTLAYRVKDVRQFNKIVLGL